MQPCLTPLEYLNDFVLFCPSLIAQFDFEYVFYQFIYVVIYVVRNQLIKQSSMPNRVKSFLKINKTRINWLFSMTDMFINQIQHLVLAHGLLSDDRVKSQFEMGVIISLSSQMFEVFNLRLSKEAFPDNLIHKFPYSNLHPFYLHF